MKKIWLSLILVGALSSNLHSWSRLGNTATAFTHNAGDKAEGIAVTVNDSSPTIVYTGVAKHREVLLQNTSENFLVYCGTHSAVLATSGPRWILPQFPSGNFTNNGTYSIWCIVESGGGSVEILGSAEFDSRD